MLIAYEIVIPLLVGLAVSRYLRDVLRRLLIDLCGTAERSEFWVRVTTVLISAFPVLLALWFGHSDARDANLASVLRTALIMTTAGIVAGVAVMAWSIAKSMPKAAK
jgi:predicted outer membrane lipoprotein